MPLSWNEIKSRALSFSRTWADAADEASLAKPFWIAFFEIFGITDKRVATFELAVKKHGGGQGFVDLFWPGMLLVEHKSRGRDLNQAFDQALGYFPGLPERDLPQLIVVCDFARFRVHKLPGGETLEFALADLHQNVGLFGLLAGYKQQVIRPQDPVNFLAAEKMGRLHDALKASGFGGHALEVLLVRLLFCLFADDTGIFQPAQALRSFIEERTAQDGSDLGARLAQLFQVLNTPEGRRSTRLDEQLAAFPYVNGGLFQEALPLADFDSTMRDALLDACALDWSAISPAIFGSLFQSIMDAAARRNLGAHYTSEENILKLIKPLFLDALWAEFERFKGQRNRLFDFHKKLRTLTFFDPACGCGNFLVVAYRELRQLELAVLRASQRLSGHAGQQSVDVHGLIGVNVDQFYGIEIEEFPAQIAQVALWLADHQMNLRVSEEFGLYFARIPLATSPHVVHGNALTLDWTAVLPAQRCSYVLGNPPFVGAKFMNEAQRGDTRVVFDGMANAGLLDLVTAWYVKAARYLKQNQAPGQIQQALTATNSGTHQANEGQTPTSNPDSTQANEGRISISNLTTAQVEVDRHPISKLTTAQVEGDRHPISKLTTAQVEGDRHPISNLATAHTTGHWNPTPNATALQVNGGQIPISPHTASQVDSVTAKLGSDPHWPDQANSPRCAFVSTNSITQGEQVGVLWGWLLAQGIQIHFAHRTFRWSNEGRGVAAVHCVIIGFGLQEHADKVIFEYDDIAGEPHAVPVGNINPYLVDAPDVVLPRRNTPLCAVPDIGIGNKPIDDGNYLFTTAERDAFVVREPASAPWFRRWLGADEFINGFERWCLWLGDCPPATLRAMPEAMKRVQAVKAFRLASKSLPTRKLAETPTRFHVENIPQTPYLLIPRVSSERRRFVPTGYIAPDTLTSDSAHVAVSATLYHFGILTSTMHNAWLRAVCGRLKSDYRYSAAIVYNNFPWPDLPGSCKQNQPPAQAQQAQAAIENAAQAVLDARARYQQPADPTHKPATLADLYDPLAMPPELLKTHQKLDAAVDAAYLLCGGKKKWASEPERVAFLFARYQQLTSLLPADKSKSKRRAK